MRFQTTVSLFIIVLTAACSNTEKAADFRKPYFDISGFFKNEAERLNRTKPIISKSVEQNENKEKKTVQHIDWMSELALFLESDINKPSWKNSYDINKTDSGVEYVAKDEELRTRRISITFNSQKRIKEVAIQNKTSNVLFSSTELLHYYPDSAYLISKDQRVIVLGSNVFRINGLFSHSSTSNN